MTPHLGAKKTKCPLWVEKNNHQCFDCDGVDSIEHYASCPFQWKVLAHKFRMSMFPCSLPRFIGGYAVELDEKVFHAVHMYAVMSAFNSRKHAGIASGTGAIEALIWNGHSTAQLYHRGLEKRYKSIISRTNAGTLHSPPPRQLFQSHMRTPIGPRSASGPINFTSADDIDSCPRWLGIPTTIDPDSDLDA